ncbi:MAG: O-antigen ligase family protein [Oscillospiraceae bacterium]|nr:O-antigen ligase family protein [Oscillospiraceae bacterium]
MDKTTRTENGWLGRNWLTVLIAAQPLLDTLAYFTQNKAGTAAGYIRLALMVLLPVYVLLTKQRKLPFFLGLAAIGAFCALHALNCLRVGYLQPAYDIAYMARVAQMPVLCLSFIWLMESEQTRRQAYRGIVTAALIMAVSVPIAWITGTGNVTYGPGLGYSGWVIDDNRCANSILLVTLSCFDVWYAVKTQRKWLSVLIPVAVATLFLTNGTKACYVSLFAIFAAYAGYLVLRAALGMEKLRKLLLIVLVLLMVFAVVVYPYTPRYRVDQHLAKEDSSGEIEATLLAMGIDVTTMSYEERYNDPVVKSVFEHYYWKYLGVLPDLIDRFGMDRVLREYRMTTNVAKLIDTRVMERSYAHMIWTEETDALTKIVGFEATLVGTDGRYDMENDWPAVFFYYGYLGTALYCGLILYFILRILLALKRDFRSCLTADDFVLALCLGLQLGLAQFSGALVRRPNVSVYLAVVLALIWYETRPTEEKALTEEMAR